MALVLTQPNHVMYLPLSNHLLAKASLDFSTVPELYTFLHSSEINYKEHQSFILELLKDGLRTEKDLTDFMRSMAFKLFSELYSSSLSDTETKVLILNVIQRICKIPIGVKMLTENHSLLSQLFSEVNNIIQGFVKDKYNPSVVDKIVYILLAIVKIVEDRNTHFITFLILKGIITHPFSNYLIKDNRKLLFQSLYVIISKFPDLFSEDLIKILLEKNDDTFCRYLYKFGCHFIDVKSCDIDSEYYYLRLLIKEYAISKYKVSCNI